MAKHLTSTADLKAYTFRKLGSEVHDVEITDLQWGDILADATKFFRDYSEYASHTEHVVIDATGVSELQLDESVLAITRCHTGSDLGNVFNYLIPSSSFLYQVVMNGSSGGMLGAYTVMRQYIDMINQLLSIPVVFNYNSEENKIYFANSSYTVVGMEVVIASDIEALVNDIFFKMIVEMLCLKQWARNINLKYNVEDASVTGNGLKLNPSEMMRQAEALEERIMDGIENDEFGSSMGPIRIYD